MKAELTVPVEGASQGGLQAMGRREGRGWPIVLILGVCALLWAHRKLFRLYGRLKTVLKARKLTRVRTAQLDVLEMADTASKACQAIGCRHRGLGDVVWAQQSKNQANESEWFESARHYRPKRVYLVIEIIIPGRSSARGSGQYKTNLDHDDFIRPSFRKNITGCFLPRGRKGNQRSALRVSQKRH